MAETPLLLCSLGDYSLRGRPLLAGLPLSDVAGVHPASDLIPFPGAPAGMLGVAHVDGQAVSVFSLAALLDLPASSETRPDHFVLLRRGARPVALAVAEASATTRPLHLAAAETLAPLDSPLVAAALPRVDGWVAVLDAARLPA